MNSNTIDIKEIFDRITETSGFSVNCKELLDRIMNITSPMLFNDSFATDEELERLEDELDKIDCSAPILRNFKAAVSRIPARCSNIDFI